MIKYGIYDNKKKIMFTGIMFLINKSYIIYDYIYEKKYIYIYKIKINYKKKK